MKFLPVYFLNILLLTTLLLTTLLLTTLLIVPLSTAQATLPTKPKIQQGVSNKSPIDITHYWVSEKLDGMRGYWDGKQLLSRQGHRIFAPKWFTKNWPSTTIDGELWLGRNTFQQLMSCVKTLNKKKRQIESCWNDVRFMVFDLPKHTGDFDHRVQAMKTMEQQHYSPYLLMIQQDKLKNSQALNALFTKVTENQGEGLMLHLGSSIYRAGRTPDIIKLKKHEDAEAKVIEHIPGKGKYEGMLGSIKVITSKGIVFKIGSGFTDNERKNPPIIGSIITYKYNGKTQSGIPRFARYFRKRVTY